MFCLDLQNDSEIFFGKITRTTKTKNYLKFQIKLKLLSHFLCFFGSL